MKRLLKTWSAMVAVASLLQPALMLQAAAQSVPLVTAQPNPGADVSPYFTDPANDPVLPDATMAELLRQKVKYVFVIFNENESFDHEYGTFPGVNGLYSDGQNPRSAANTPGFTQTYTDVNGNEVTVQPFRIGPQQNATFADSTDHSHKGLATKLDVVDGVPKMDGFAKDEYSLYAKVGNNASQAVGTQFARIVMEHVDCDTIPFFWQYASRFAIFDNIFATEDTPSTPNAIAMIAGQSGETQWVEHPSPLSTSTSTTLGFTGPISGTINGNTYTGTATAQGEPEVNDPQPYWGSAFDTTASNREPTAPKENWAPTNTASNQTYASVPLTLAGSSVTSVMAQDKNPSLDLPDIQEDMPYIQNFNGTPVNWRWYQNGYDTEPNDATHTNYVSHHNGPQYFGYLADNPAELPNLRGENDFFDDIANNNLPAAGGVFYIRGGYFNIKGQTPPIQNPNYPNTAGLTAADIAKINAAKSGDDDHPSYSDHQLTEAMNARVINAIASNPTLWSQSAIIITYDESDGLYDHVPPQILSYGPDGLPLARGIRIPMIVISPYARTHVTSHAEGDHNAVIETLNAIFGLPPLSSLPDEAQALAAGNSPTFNQYGPPGFQQHYLGPRDTNSPITDSLLSAFSPQRLRGLAPPLPASLAIIPSARVESLPHDGGNGCKAIGMTPTDASLPNSIPPNFNTLPSTLPAYN
jgi:phospholipase C